MPGFIKLIRRIGLIGLIILFALLLRLWGIGHGLPHVYSVDEPALVRSVLGLRFDLNPHHFDWPHFHFYLCYLFFVLLVKFRALLQVLNLRSVLEPLATIFWQDPQIFYLQMRVISALMGAATIIPIYLIGRKLFNRKIGLLASLIFAIAPLAVENAHYATLDSPLTFWVAWAVYFSVLAFFDGRWRNYLLAGFFTGIAASTKYNGIFVSLSVLSAGIFSFRKSLESVRGVVVKLIAAGLVCLLAFFGTTPFLILDYQKALTPVGQPHAWHGLPWQFSRSGNHLDAGAPGRILSTVSSDLVQSMGLLPLAFTGVSLFVLLKVGSEKKRRLGFLLLFPVLFFLLFASGEFRMIHYFLPILPSLTVLSAVGLGWGLEKLEKLGGLGAVGLVSLILLLPLSSSIRASYILSQKDTRQLASDWVEENVSKGSKIVQRGEYQPVLGGFELIGAHDLSAGWLEENEIDFVVVTSYAPTEQDRLGLTLAREIVPHLQPGPTVLIYEVGR